MKLDFLDYEYVLKSSGDEIGPGPFLVAALLVACVVFLLA